MNIQSDSYLDFVAKSGPAPAYAALYDEYFRDPDLFDRVQIDDDDNIIIDTDNGFVMIG